MNLTFKLKRFLNGAGNKGLLKYLNWLSCEENFFFSNLFTDNLCKKYILSGEIDYDVLSGSDIEEDEFLKKDFDSLLNFYQKIFLPGFVCHHTDRASMFNSLEVRSPFLNKDIIKFANSLSKNFKYKNNKTKYILRKALEKLGGSKELISRKKMGFTMPLARWQKLFFKDEILTLPKKISDASEGNIDYRSTQRMVLDHLDGRRNHYQLIHSMMIFVKWRERNSSFNFVK